LDVLDCQQLATFVTIHLDGNDSLKQYISLDEGIYIHEGSSGKVLKKNNVSAKKIALQSLSFLYKYQLAAQG
jgi:hypothetical protein